MKEEEAATILELRALLHSIDKMIAKLDGLNKVTSEGGMLFESQRKACATLGVWEKLLSIASKPEEETKTPMLEGGSAGKTIVV